MQDLPLQLYSSMLEDMTYSSRIDICRHDLICVPLGSALLGGQRLNGTQAEGLRFRVMGVTRVIIWPTEGIKLLTKSP